MERGVNEIDFTTDAPWTDHQRSHMEVLGLRKLPALIVDYSNDRSAIYYPDGGKNSAGWYWHICAYEPPQLWVFEREGTVRHHIPMASILSIGVYTTLFGLNEDERIAWSMVHELKEADDGEDHSDHTA